MVKIQGLRCGRFRGVNRGQTWLQLQATPVSQHSDALACVIDTMLYRLGDLVETVTNIPLPRHQAPRHLDLDTSHETLGH